MLYCVKCRCLSPAGTAKCQNCKSSKLRPVDGDDLVLLHRADEHTAGKLAEQFEEAGLVYTAEPYAKGLFTPLYDSEIMPTDKNLFVRYSDLEAAEELSRRMKEELDAANGNGEEEFEDMPLKKRILVQALSVIAFLLLVMLAVFGADAFANWVKSFFGL